MNFVQPAKTNIFSTINIFGFGKNASTNSSTFEIPAGKRNILIDLKSTCKVIQDKI